MPLVTPEALHTLEDPIRQALLRYDAMSDHVMDIDFEAAAHPELTPDKPYSARSPMVPVNIGDQALQLTVTVLAPGDCIGNTNPATLAEYDDFNLAGYPRKPGIIPPARLAAHTEAHLSLASIPAANTDTDPVLFAGSLHLLHGGGPRWIGQLGMLGQRERAHAGSMHRGKARPSATAVTGYATRSRELHAGWGHEPRGVGSQRFGIAYSIYNGTEDIQAFALLSTEMGPRNHSQEASATELFKALRTKIPDRLFMTGSL